MMFAILYGLLLFYYYFFKKTFQGFPGSPVFKNLPVNAGDVSSIPVPERSPMPQSN